MIEICILSGGKSKRMGRDKADLPLGTKTVLDHVLATAAKTGWPRRIIEQDVIPDQGPLGGAHTGLSQSTAEIVLFLSCDMPFLSVETLLGLVEELAETDQAVFVESDRGVGFPFAARRATLPCVERMLQEGERSLHQFARRTNAKRIRMNPAKSSELFNMNTPEDHRTAQERWEDIS